MTASTLALTLMRSQYWSVSFGLAPVVTNHRTFGRQSVKVTVLLQHDFAKDIVLPNEHSLQANQLQDRQKGADQRGARAQTAQERLEANRLVFQREPPAHVLNH